MDPMTLEFFTCIKARRSVRRFRSDPISQETLEKLLEAARLAPSAGNVQPWIFYVVRSKQVQERLADAALGQTWMLSAPAIVVVCADLSRAQNSYGRRGVELYALQDTAAAVENLLLAAVAEGLAGCWVGAFREEVAAAALEIDRKQLRPLALVPLGYADETPRTPPKRAAEDTVIYVD